MWAWYAQYLIVNMLDESATTVDPKGLALLLIGVSIFFLIPTAIVVILRCFVRWKYSMFGRDDGLMLFGWVSYYHDKWHRLLTMWKLLHVAFTAVGIHAIYTGVGTKDIDLNDFLQVEGRKVISSNHQLLLTHSNQSIRSGCGSAKCSTIFH
jgi:hypothetical protein